MEHQHPAPPNKSDSPGQAAVPDSSSPPATPVKDPVCGMTVNPEKSKRTADHAGKIYYFCSDGCLHKFKTDPGKYLDLRSPQPPTPAAPFSPFTPFKPFTPSSSYICPMHPEVEQPGPGSCPKCGMALEPKEIAADEDTSELLDMQRRFWVSCIFTLPVFALAMGEHIPGNPLERLVSGPLRAWIELILSTPVVLWAGQPILQRGWSSLRTLHFNMFTLIALGTMVAYLYSLIATLFPGAFPAAFRGADGTVAIYFEAAAVIMTLVLLGQVLELRARSQTSSAIKALLGLAPKTARLVRPDGSEEDIPLSRVQPGDRLRVRPGEKIPVDGRIEEGLS
ncbi:MAG: YHS domain-containing protein, partial [bacterium]